MTDSPHEMVTLVTGAARLMLAAAGRQS